MTDLRACEDDRVDDLSDSVVLEDVHRWACADDQHPHGDLPHHAVVAVLYSIVDCTRCSSVRGSEPHRGSLIELFL